MREDFETTLARAREWEIKVARWLRRRGWYVLPAYDFSGKGESKAPKLLGPDGFPSLVLPDLLCLQLGRCQWVEVKWKREAAFYRKGGYLTTGINARLWRHYCEVEQRAGGEVFIVFLHEKEREIRGDRISRLRQYISHTYSGEKMGMSGMVFWPYQSMPRWASIDSLSAGEVALKTA